MRPTSIRQIIAAFLIVFFILLWSSLTGSAEPLGSLQVSFIDVGQGDASLLQDSNGFDVLIDGGPASAGTSVVGFLKERGVDRIEVLVVSHAHEDHIGGLLAVLQDNEIIIDAVVISGYAGTSQTWHNFMGAVTARGLTPTTAQFPQDYQWGSMQVHVLNPPAGQSYSDLNDSSLVLRVDHGETNILFTGDINQTIEAQVAVRGTPVTAEILKVAHHGSQYSSGELFLGLVNASDAVISVGKNSYGHPSAETLQRLFFTGANIWRSDLSGNVLMISDGLTYRVLNEVTASPIFLYFPIISRQEIIQ